MCNKHKPVYHYSQTKQMSNCHESDLFITDTSNSFPFAIKSRYLILFVNITYSHCSCVMRLFWRQIINKLFLLLPSGHLVAQIKILSFIYHLLELLIWQMFTRKYRFPNPSDSQSPFFELCVLLVLSDVNACLTEEWLNSCWLAVVLMSWIMYKLVRRRDHLRSDDSPTLPQRWAALSGFFFFSFPPSGLWCGYTAEAKFLLGAKMRRIFCSSKELLKKTFFGLWQVVGFFVFDVLTVFFSFYEYSFLISRIVFKHVAVLTR